MKTTLLIFLMLGYFLGGYAQGSSCFPVEKAQVLYKPLSSALRPGVQAKPDFQVRVRLSLILKPACEADSIFLVMSEKPGSIVLYQIAYSLERETLSDENGNVLFDRQGNIVLLGCPLMVPLKPYHYRIYTKSREGTPSPVYAITQ